jgi:HEAT repeat protein
VPTDESTLPPDLEERLLKAGFHSDGRDDAFLLESLESRRPRQRVLALRAGSRRALLAREHWMRALVDPQVEVRREALALLAYVNDLDGGLLALVRGSLEDDDALVVDAAIFALGEHLDRDAVERLATIALEHDDARCRESAVASLGAIGDDRGRAAVLAALEDKPPVRRRAIVALSNFEGPDVDAALERAANDRDWQVRAAVDQLNKEVD